MEKYREETTVDREWDVWVGNEFCCVVDVKTDRNIAICPNKDVAIMLARIPEIVGMLRHFTVNADLSETEEVYLKRFLDAAGKLGFEGKST